MEIRKAAMEDLAQLKNMYKQIVQNMNDNDIQIWDDIYPCEFFEDDINKKQLYVLTEKKEIISAFVLCETHSGERKVHWNMDSARTVYLDRLGVNINHRNKGMGNLSLDRAKEIAGSNGFDCLRLFVVDKNIPAIRLYKKYGFIKAEGIYEEVFDDDFVLREYGYEIKI